MNDFTKKNCMTQTSKTNITPTSKTNVIHTSKTNEHVRKRYFPKRYIFGDKLDENVSSGDE